MGVHRIDRAEAGINEWLEDKAWRDDAYTYGRALSKQEVIDYIKTKS